ncbi:hypothetical protein N7454_001645 [Penicillium verhagenii]|nr:hypothetical protein N7454_001645 [Penicillium verhagenii]
MLVMIQELVIGNRLHFAVVPSNDASVQALEVFRNTKVPTLDVTIGKVGAAAIKALTEIRRPVQKSQAMVKHLTVAGIGAGVALFG